eukprot:365169-Chlamydomonas_euryale.AAC.6
MCAALTHAVVAAAGYYGQDCALSTSHGGKMQLLADHGYHARSTRPHVYVYELPAEMEAWCGRAADVHSHVHTSERSRKQGGPCHGDLHGLHGESRRRVGCGGGRLSPSPRAEWAWSGMRLFACMHVRVGRRYSTRRMDRALHVVFQQRLLSSGARTTDPEDADWWVVKWEHLPVCNCVPWLRSRIGAHCVPWLRSRIGAHCVPWLRSRIGAHCVSWLRSRIGAHCIPWLRSRIGAHAQESSCNCGGGIDTSR